MAKKIKYHFDPLHLKYYKVSPSFKQKFLRFLYISSGALVFATVIIVIAFSTIDSPKEKVLKREIEQYKMQYDILNDRFDKASSVLKDLEDRDDNIYRVIFESEPVPSSIRKGGYGGNERYSKLEGYNNSELIKGTTAKLDRISRDLFVESKSFDEVLEMAKQKAIMLQSIPAILPVPKSKFSIASGFGFRFHPIYKVLKMHTGVDITCRIGTPVFATGDGIVIPNDASLGSFGIVCMIDHGYGYKTIYGHLSKVIVRPGQKVKRGQIIAYSGNSGVSIGPHLHYELRKNDKPINPVNYFYKDLTPEEYKKVLEESSKINQSLS